MLIYRVAVFAKPLVITPLSTRLNLIYGRSITTRRATEQELNPYRFKRLAGQSPRIYRDSWRSLEIDLEFMRLAVLMASMLVGQGIGSWDLDAKTTAQALVGSLEKCSPRVVVAKFKNGWTKNTWGPPTNFDYDVVKTNSIRWPYQIVISYTLPWSGTKDRKKREEAEQDTRPDLVLKNSEKNIYQMGDDGSLRLSETFVQGLDGGWTERRRWPDACWDQLPKSQE